jgi:hypothetical protein
MVIILLRYTLYLKKTKENSTGTEVFFLMFREAQFAKMAHITKEQNKQPIAFIDISIRLYHQCIQFALVGRATSAQR